MAVMVILKEEETWESARKQMLKLDFLPRLRNINKESITKQIDIELRKYTGQTKFKCREAAKYSCGAAFLCDWVLNIGGSDHDHDAPVKKEEPWIRPKT